MRRCVPVALLGLGLLAVGSRVPALASPTRYHVGRVIYGCVDPQATVALDGPEQRQGDRAWAGWVRRNGRCFALGPALRLDVISRQAGLALVRRVPPRIGEPPLFVLERDVHALPPDAQPSPSETAAAPRSGGGSAATTATSAGDGNHTSALAGGATPVRQTAGAAIGDTGDGSTSGFAPGSGTAAAAGADDTQEPPNPVPIPAPVPTQVSTPVPVPVSTPTPDPGSQADPAGAGAASTAEPPPSVPPSPTPAMLPPVAPSVATPPPSPVAPPQWPPRFRPPPLQPQRIGVLIVLVLTLLLVGAVAAALVVARRRRHFAHVEEAADWPPGGSSQVVELRPAAPAVPTAIEFRKHCAAALSSAGWATQLAFPGDGSGPDIVARRDAVVAAVRCRASNTAVTGEMVDEAAVMGSRHGATLTLLASNAPFSQRARDEAIRHGILLLRDSELASFVG